MNRTSRTIAGSRVLIVDDLAANLNLLRETLEPMGCEIFAANSAVRALELIPRTQPDLILLDVHMPDMDGFAVCQTLKDNPSTAGIPIVFITADREIDSLVRGFRIGAIDYIAKPFQPDEVRLRVETHLKLRHALRELQERNEELASEIARRCGRQLRQIELPPRRRSRWRGTLIRRHRARQSITRRSNLARFPLRFRADCESSSLESRSQ